MQPESKIVFIINPAAGTRQKEFARQSIRQQFDPDRFEIIFTEYPGHAYEAAMHAVRQGIKYIVAVGGDGTVNEVGSALVNTKSILGIIPSGSGNGLARQLGIALHVSEALQTIKNHKIKTIDAGRMNDRFFFCTFGTGFDASVGQKFSHESRRGWLTYVRATIHQYITYSPKAYVLRTGHKKVKIKAFLVTFANIGQYGNNAYIAPNAVIDDGFLDLCILRPFPKASTITLGLRLFFKNIDQSPYLEVMKIKKASLKRKGKRKIAVQLDGEPMTLKGKLKIRVIPDALQVMVPARSRRMISRRLI